MFPKDEEKTNRDMFYELLLIRSAVSKEGEKVIGILQSKRFKEKE